MSHHFIVTLLLVQSMNDTSWVLSSNFLVGDVMGYISYPKVLSSCIMVFLPYHAKWGKLLSNKMLSLHIYTADDVSAVQHHVFMFITVNKACYNNVNNDYDVSFILSIDPWCITTSSFYGDVVVINKKVGNICLVFQGAIFSNSHMFAWMLFIFQCCEDEANDTDRGLFGCSRKYPEHYSLLTNDGDHGS